MRRIKKREKKMGMSGPLGLFINIAGVAGTLVALVGPSPFLTRTKAKKKKAKPACEEIDPRPMLLLL